MNKAETREVNKARAYMAHFERTQDAAILGIVARMMGAAVRATMSDKGRRELMAVADELGVSGHSDYIVGRWA